MSDPAAPPSPVEPPSGRHHVPIWDEQEIAAGEEPHCTVCGCKYHCWVCGGGVNIQGGGTHLPGCSSRVRIAVAVEDEEGEYHDWTVPTRPPAAPAAPVDDRGAS